MDSSKKEIIKKLKQLPPFRDKPNKVIDEYTPSSIDYSTAEFELTGYSFTLTGHGYSGDSCQRPYMHGYTIDIETLDTKANFGLARCDRIECHHCSPFLLQNKIYEAAYKLYSYKLETAYRLYSLSVSLPPSVYKEIRTAKDFHDAKRTLTNFTKSIGIKGGLMVLHPFSIQTKVRQRMRKEGLSWSEMWDVVQYNRYGYNSWLEYVDLHVHYHIIGFSDVEIQTTTKGNKVCKVFGELESLDDLIKTLQYIFSHIATFNETDRENKTIDIKSHNYFGSLYLYSASENIELKDKIASSINGYYDIEKDKFSAYPIPNDEKYQYFSLNKSKKHKHKLFIQMYNKITFDNCITNPTYNIEKQYQPIEKYNPELENEKILNKIIEEENKQPVYEQQYLVPITYTPIDKHVSIKEIHTIRDNIQYCIEYVQYHNFFPKEELIRTIKPISKPLIDDGKSGKLKNKLERFNYIAECILMYESIASDTSLPSHERHLFVGRMPHPPKHLYCEGLDLKHIRSEYNPAYNLMPVESVETFGTEHKKYRLKYKEVFDTSLPYESLLVDAQSFSSRIARYTQYESAWEREQKHLANLSLTYHDVEIQLDDGTYDEWQPDFSQLHEITMSSDAYYYVPPLIALFP